MKNKKKFIAAAALSRRDFLSIAGVGIVAVTFFPKIAFSADNQIVSIRTGLRPGNQTRLVIETTGRPVYSLSYPEGRLAVSLDARGSLAPKLVDGTLIKNIDVQNGKITANLRKSIAPIPKSQILILNPTGDSRYRLVLDFAAGSASDKSKYAAETATAKQAAARKPVIVIDPGHGGKDPGCIGGSGTQEKDIALSVAKKLHDRLNGAGYNAYLTRKNDTFLNLDTRSDIAEKKKADLFVSIHANSNPKKTIKGFSVYTLSQTASDAEAQKLAEAENAADKIDVGGFRKYEPEIRFALSSLQQRAVDEESVTLAEQIIQATRKSGISSVDKARRFAPFAVLKSTVPSCLVELGHLSNKDEEKLLKSADHQNKLIGALVSAIGNYDFTA
ncbi:MAG: N-acetylmuramoyl-L-alanine amidase [Rickettsiales bacterium]|jgi:N-acetylmuramoyl-L-alanine amidase|nr:N-acetylmuramoyl-L-alanine amidase [Rickettsiales bacterium]